MSGRIPISGLLAVVAALVACSPTAPGDGPSTSPTTTSFGAPANSSSATRPPKPTVSASPGGPSSPGQPSPEPTADAAIVLAADGIGPYVVGASLADLQARGLVTSVAASIHCDPVWQGAEASGRHAGMLNVTFHEGRLVDVATQSMELVTPSGAQVGMPLTQLRQIYGSRGRLIEGVSGNQAFSVRVPATPLGIVFYLDQTDSVAVSMSAGGAERLERAAETGEGC